MLPFGLCNALNTFQREVLAIFVDLKFVEIYMDDFSVLGDPFQEALKNLEKVLLHCQESHLALSDKKCRLMCKAGVVLHHLISSKGIQVDPTKIVLEPVFTSLRHRSFLYWISFFRCLI